MPSALGPRLAPARILPVLALALAILLAGCLGAKPATTPTSPTAPTAAHAPTAGVFHYADGVLAPSSAGEATAIGGEYLTGVRGTEPTVAVTKDITVFTDAVFPQGAANRSEPTVMRSTDKGQTWKDVGPTLPTSDKEPPTTGDPIVYVDPNTDRVFWLNQVETACANLFMSDDKGATWTPNPASCGTPGLVDHVTIVTAKPRMLPTVGYPDVVYMCANSIYQTGCATSLDGGHTFGPLRMVYPGADPTSPQGFCGGIHSLPRAGPDGKVYVAKNQCGTAQVAISDDDGLTWTPHTIDTKHAPYGNEVHVAIDEKNNVYAIWTGDADGLVWFASSHDGGKTWAPAINVTAPGVTAADLPVIAAGGEGKVAFAYIGTTIPGGYKGKTVGNAGLAGDVLGQPDAPDWKAATWNAYVGVMTDALSPHPLIQSLTANDPADPLARGLCGHTRCHGMNDFIDATVDKDGRPWISFIDTCTAKCITDNNTLADRTIGMVATLVSGPALRGDAGATLAPIAPPKASGGGGAATGDAFDLATSAPDNARTTSPDASRTLLRASRGLA
ncbi:MAG: sialidase family protein [Thermoplasmatota archaeon]